MAREHNFLLGAGERLADTISIQRGGGQKNPPYSLPEAKRRVQILLDGTIVNFASQPVKACPQDRAVVVVTMHPRYISKSDYPTDLLNEYHLKVVGSRARDVIPGSWGIERHPEEAVGEDLFVSGLRRSFRKWASELTDWSDKSAGSTDITHIEDIHFFAAKDKLRTLPATAGARPLLEVVLHNAGEEGIVGSFAEYASECDAEAILRRRQDAHGLTFIPVFCDRDRLSDLASFSFIRLVRAMPTLRPVNTPSVIRASALQAQLPDAPPIDPDLKAAVFDGGIPPAMVTSLSRWVKLIEPIGIGPAVPAFQGHGLAVTSSLLFGPLPSQGILPTPYCPVDHVRVLDERTDADASMLYMDVLDRILEHLRSNPGKYQLANLSIGPNIETDDDDVTAWTALLDGQFSDGLCVVTVAAGNEGPARIQPPADAVNVLSVGATDSQTNTWAKASYSCVGPGRCPGLVKPDGVAFGGSGNSPFMVLSDGMTLTGTEGTSFASPLVLRSAAAARSQLGDSIGSLAIRSLLIHRAVDDGRHQRDEVGWGVFEDNPLDLITCKDCEALVIYQGELPVGMHLRARIPYALRPVRTTIVISATIVISSDVDPEHPSSYTRSGLEVTFRPHSQKHKVNSDGQESAHAASAPFFSARSMYGRSEYLLRQDGHKWEPCLKSSKAFRASSLHEPCFDIYYHHRSSASSGGHPEPMPYAMVVGIEAKSVVDFYSRTLRAYAGILQPLMPRTLVQIRT